MLKLQYTMAGWARKLWLSFKNIICQFQGHFNIWWAFGQCSNLGPKSWRKLCSKDSNSQQPGTEKRRVEDRLLGRICMSQVFKQWAKLYTQLWSRGCGKTFAFQTYWWHFKCEKFSKSFCICAWRYSDLRNSWCVKCNILAANLKKNPLIPKLDSIIVPQNWAQPGCAVWYAWWVWDSEIATTNRTTM